jgi:hypothetical protein
VSVVLEVTTNGDVQLVAAAPFRLHAITSVVFLIVAVLGLTRQRVGRASDS